MDSNGFLKKKKLHSILEKSLTISSLEVKELNDFKEYLRDVLRHIWVALAGNECLDTDTWLLYSRVGVVGLQVFSYTDELFCDTVHFLSSLEHSTTEVYIKEIKLKALINNPDFFKISVLYGALNVLLMRKTLYRDEFRFLYDYIIVQCQQQSRHNSLYFHLLASYVQNFSEYITKEDYTNIFDTVYYNLDKKNCCTVLQYILNKTDELDASNILYSVLFSMSWKYKQKYILLNEILQKHNLINDSVSHDECIKGLIYAQSKTYLASAGAKLYNTIVKHLESNIWLEKYYPAFEKIIINTGSPTLCHRNILKYYMNADSSFPCCLMDLLEKMLNLKSPPVYTILYLTLVGIKRKTFPEKYSFVRIGNLGWDHEEDYIRAMSFSVICSTTDVDTGKSYRVIRNYIKLNINDAGPATRDSIKKSYALFLTRLEHKICQISKISTNIPALNHSADFFNWLVPFLLAQFKPTSNYQRLTLSVCLLHITLVSFSRQKQIIDKKSLQIYRKYYSNVNVFYNLNAFLSQFIDVLKMCQMEETQKIIQLLLSELEFTKISDNKISSIEQLGLTNICNSNMEVADFGRKLLEFVNHIKSDKKKDRLEKVNEMMHQQWERIKASTSEDIIVQNPLHPLISLMTSTISSYSPKEYYKILSFIDDVVSNLLNVFGIRAMLPYNHECCTGIAKAFENESSEYRSCVVNCMWLVLKACCKLSVQLVKIAKTANIMRRSLHVLNSVIQKCYHKGALEEAGEALAHIVSSATTQNYCVFVIDEFLNTVLENVTKATEVSSTVRRAAEIRIVISAIAVNDRRSHKPLFHTTMDYLIRILDACLLNKNSEKDPVHALALHCLQPIIINNLVETHIVEYISTVAIISLSSFESKNWKVRNAALQTFGAVSNKLLGTTVSDDNDSNQHHATCMEEVFYKHPAIYQYILARICESIALPEKHCDIIIPVLSFINMSYARDDQLVECTKKKMSELAERLLQYIDIAPNMNIFILAAKAYSSMCYHREIVDDVQRLSDGILENVDNNNYISLIFTMKILTDKIIEDVKLIPNFSNVVTDILEKIGSALTKSSNRKSFYKIISGILFYRLQLESVTIEQMKKDLLYLTTNSELAVKLPGIWECVENKMKQILKSEKISTIKDLIKFCFDNPIPLNIKVSCIKILLCRVQENKEVKVFCEQELINLFMEVILDKEYMWIKYLTDECVELIIQLDVGEVNECLMNKIVDSIDDFKNNLFPRNYMAVFCSIYLYVFEENQKIIEFLEWCVEQCLLTLEEDDPDVLILKSVKFIWWYGNFNHIDNIKFKSLKVVYKMLQRDEIEIKTECEIMFTRCFSLTSKHPYMNMLAFIHRDNLIKLLSPKLALKFLVQIYSEREDRIYSINVFDKKSTLPIETDIVDEVIYEQTFDVFKFNIRTKERQKLNSWFTYYKQSKPNNKYVKIIGKIIERNGL